MTDPFCRRHEARIRAYYTCFNERRFTDAVAMFTDDAAVEQVPFQPRQRGGAAYHAFATLWIRAFPDAVMAIERISAGPDDTCEVELLSVGTHRGDLPFGSFTFRPTEVTASIRLREVLEFRGEQIVGASLTFDFQQLAQELARVDEARLFTHLDEVGVLATKLRSLPVEHVDRRRLQERIGQELDAARRAVRPYYFSR